MSPNLLNFVRVDMYGSGDFPVKSSLWTDCSQLSNTVVFQWWCGEQSGALVGQSLWSVLVTSTLWYTFLSLRMDISLSSPLVNNTLFMEDGAPCHTAKMTKEWQDRNGIKWLPWPSQSLEMNPIEHLWAILDRAVWKKSRKPTSRAELLTRLREAWAEIPQEKILELVSSMPERVKSLKSANGKSTKY